jgi:hypothetical protein
MAYIFHSQKRQDLKVQYVNIKSGMRYPSYRNTLMPKWDWALNPSISYFFSPISAYLSQLTTLINLPF